MSFGAYLTTKWLPGKRHALRATTWDGYRRRIDRPILPTLGRRPIRRLRPAHLEALYESLLHPAAVVEEHRGGGSTRHPT